VPGGVAVAFRFGAPQRVLDHCAAYQRRGERVVDVERLGGGGSASRTCPRPLQRPEPA
jgi:hypothetical protein